MFLTFAHFLCIPASCKLWWHYEIHTRGADSGRFWAPSIRSRLVVSKIELCPIRLRVKRISYSIYLSLRQFQTANEIEEVTWRCIRPVRRREFETKTGNEMTIIAMVVSCPCSLVEVTIYENPSIIPSNKICNDFGPRIDFYSIVTCEHELMCITLQFNFENSAIHSWLIWWYRWFTYNVEKLGFVMQSL